MNGDQMAAPVVLNILITSQPNVVLSSTKDPIALTWIPGLKGKLETKGKVGAAVDYYEIIKKNVESGKVNDIVNENEQKSRTYQNKNKIKNWVYIKQA